MKRSIICFICFGHALALTTSASGQNNAQDSAFYRQAVQQTVAVYSNGMGESTNLYNGKEYIYSSHGVKGHPFYESDQPQKGTIEFNRTFYPEIFFSYDLVQDKVFLVAKGMSFNIQLDNYRVQDFTMLGHHFVSLTGDSSLQGLPGPGYYDLIYDGKLKVLVKRSKRVEAAFKAEDSVKYVQYDDYYVRKNSSYNKVEGKKSLFALFSDEKDRIKKYFRKNKLNYKKDPENAIVMTTEYYAQLKN